MELRNEVVGDTFNERARLEYAVGAARDGEGLQLPRTGTALSDQDVASGGQHAIPVAVWGKGGSVLTRLLVIGSDVGGDPLTHDAEFSDQLFRSLDRVLDVAVFLVPAASSDSPRAAPHADSVAQVMVDPRARQLFLLPRVDHIDAHYEPAIRRRADALNVPLYVLPALGQEPQEVAQAVKTQFDVLLGTRGAAQTHSGPTTPGVPGGIPWDASGGNNRRGGRALGPNST